MACDICTKTGVSLVNLRECYQTDKIKCVCDECAKEITEHIWDISLMQRKMERRMVKRLIRYKRMLNRG